MINSVSFGNTQNVQGSSFEDLLNKPQAYQEKASAAAETKPDKFEKEGSSAIKKVGTLAALAVGIGAALAGMSKYGISNKIPKVGAYLDKAGSAIISGVKGLINKVPKAAEAAAKAAE